MPFGHIGLEPAFGNQCNHFLKVLQTLVVASSTGCRAHPFSAAVLEVERHDGSPRASDGPGGCGFASITRIALWPTQTKTRGGGDQRNGDEGEGRGAEGGEEGEEGEGRGSGARARLRPSRGMPGTAPRGLGNFWVIFG